MIGRVAAVAAVVLAVLVVGYIVFSSSTSYQVRAVFQNASQVVKGDPVEVAGNTVGSVKSVDLTPYGQAALQLSIKDSRFIPLHAGTQATVRLVSLTGIANRYIELRLGPGTAPKIPNSGIIGTNNTNTAVDIDELFDTLNAQTRRGLQNVIQGSATQLQGQGQSIQAALQYLNPAVDAASILFAEINRDTGKFTRYIEKNSSLVSDLATRSSSLSGLVTHLATVTEALQAQQVALGRSIRDLPGFMRLANNTFVNLRNALDDLTPLVNAAKPTTGPLQTWLNTVRPLAINSVPTLQDLATVICQPQNTCTPQSPGTNDLIQLTELQPALAAAACGTGPGAMNCLGRVFANGKSRSAAFPESVTALNQATPELAFARPYGPDLTGWFEGFSHPGTVDANGGASRIAVNIAGTPAIDSAAFNQLTNVLPGLSLSSQVSSLLKTVPSLQITSGQGDRCPGSMERGGVYYPESGYACNPHEVPTGP